MQSYLKKDLDEDVVITLVAKNPQAPHNRIRYDHTSGSYITQKLSETMIDHLEIESTSVHKDSAEGKLQLKAMGEDVDQQDGSNDNKIPFVSQNVDIKCPLNVFRLSYI